MRHSVSSSRLLTLLIAITAISSRNECVLSQDVPLNIFIGGSGFDSGVGAHFTLDGDIIALLTTDSKDLPTHDGAVVPEFAGGLSDAYIIRFSSETMEVQWATYYGADGFDAAHGMTCIEADNVCVVVGEGMGVMPGTEDNNPDNTGTDAWAAGFDMDTGALRWARQIEESGTQWFNGIFACPPEGAGDGVTPRLFAYATNQVCRVDGEQLTCSSSNGHSLDDALCLSPTPEDPSTARPVFFGQRGLDPSVIVADTGSVLALTQTVVPRPGLSGYQHASVHGDRVVAIENVFEDENQNPVDRSVAHCFSINGIFGGNADPFTQDLGEPAFSGFDFDAAGNAWGVRDHVEDRTQTEEAYYPPPNASCGEEMTRGTTDWAVEAARVTASVSAEVLRTTFIGTGVFNDLPDFQTPTPALKSLNSGSAAQISVLPSPTKTIQFINTNGTSWIVEITLTPGDGSSGSPVELRFDLSPRGATPMLMYDETGSYDGVLRDAVGDSTTFTGPTTSGDIELIVTADQKPIPSVDAGWDVSSNPPSILALANATDAPVRIQSLDENGEPVEDVTIGPGEGEEFHEFEKFLVDLQTLFNSRRPVFDIHVDEKSKRKAALLAVGALFISAVEGGKRASRQAVDLVMFDEAGRPYDVENVTTSNEDPGELPADRLLVEAYPNPFRSSVIFSYDLPRSEDVTLTVFDQLGRQVARLLEGPRPAGRGFTFWGGRGVTDLVSPAGVYLYRLEAGEFSRTGTVLLVK